MNEIEWLDKIQKNFEFKEEVQGIVYEIFSSDGRGQLRCLTNGKLYLRSLIGLMTHVSLPDGTYYETTSTIWVEVPR